MQSGTLKKGLTLVVLFSLMTGAMVGMAWATLVGTLFGIGGPAIILSVLLAAFFCVIIGLGYAELCGALPFVGGEHVYATRAMGPAWGFLTGWSLVLAYAAMMPAEVIIFSQVFGGLAPGIPTWLVGVIVAVLFGAVNYVGIRVSGMVQFVLSLLLFGSMAVYIFAGLPHVNLSNLTPFMGKGLGGMITVIPLMMLAFMGFDIAPQAVEEVNAPLKKVVFLIPLSIVFVAFFYSGVFLVTGGVVPVADVIADKSQVPVMTVAARFLGETGSKVIILAGLAGLVTTLNGFVVGASRLMLGMARDGVLPSALGALHPKYGTPHVGIAVLTLFGIIGAFFQQLLVVLQISSAAILLSYIVVSLSVIWLRRREPHLERPYRVPLYPITPVVAAVVSLGAFAVALMTVEAIGQIFLLVWLAAGVAYYFLIGKGKGHGQTEQVLRKVAR